jgi:serine/threonine protein kinase
LKPANILVEGSKPTEFLFKITDFGLSGFKTPEAGSNTMPYTGDCQYMPPEGRDTVANRKYDVWSLGCILLEVTAFAIRSYDGVELLDKLFPIVKTEHNYAFFRKIDGGAILRPDVVEFMDRELDSFVEESSMHDESDHLFVKNVIDLIKMMLEPSAASRLTSLEVVEHLKLLRSDLGRHTSAEVELVAAYPREIELGGQTLHSLRYAQEHN